MFIMLDKTQRCIESLRGNIYADLLVSVGNACRPAHYLRKFHLRSFSSPFDWMMNYKLEHIIHFLRNDGADFFAQISEIDKGESGYTHRFVQDKQTGMISMHDFVRERGIDECYDEFIDKHKRRFARLKSALLGAKHIVFIGNRDESMENFENFLNEMQKIHRAKYTFINVRHKEQITTRKRVIAFNGGGNHIIEYIFNDIHPKGGNGDLNPDAWLGNVEQWDKIMRQFRWSFGVTFINFWARKWGKIKRSFNKRKNAILS